VASSISQNNRRGIVALLLAAFAILTIASLATYVRPVFGMAPWTTDNACGPAGAALSYALVWVFGALSAYGVPVIALGAAWNRVRGHASGPLIVRTGIGSLLVFELCTMFGLAGLDRWRWSGAWGVASAMTMHAALGSVGSWVVLGALSGVTVIVASELGFHWIGNFAHAVLVAPAQGLRAAWGEWRERRSNAAREEERAPRVVRAKSEPKPSEAGPRPAPRSAVPARAAGSKSANGTTVSSQAAAASPQIRLPFPGMQKSDARPREKLHTPPPMMDGPPSAGIAAAIAAAETEDRPPLSLLGMAAPSEDLITASDLTAEANLLVAKLADFGIVGRVTEIHPGPVVTTFEVEPAPGVKVNQIVSREDDLALALRAQRIRILAPIPGKGAVGVEIPNRKRRTVYLREVLSAPAYEKSDAALKIPMGVDVVGQPFVYDLTKMPHMLVAGATGSGKSVCLNAIITGLLFQHGPDSLRMVMVDPKMLELSAYNGIPHLVMPVVTEPKKASRALRWAVSEMEKRYKLMATCGARNIAAYNDKVVAGLVPHGPSHADGTEAPAPDRLSYVVIVIDELADLMLTAPAEIEEPIARLAQMARAVGIHLVLATQRPSVDVITGVIKANFPSRVAFQVASKTDSRTVLDMNGAENLLGHGDMLFMPAGRPEPYRIHGCYVSEEETARIVEFWRAKIKPVLLAPGQLPTPPPLATRPDMSEADDEDDVEDSEDDALLRDAARLVVTHQQGSTSLLQRRLKVGYSRAGRLMDQLEQMGVVGPFQGSKARDVLVDERWIEDRFTV
jgi:S-DNA-T family DNA segregation ATPase FtsK/SpoIIIE